MSGDTRNVDALGKLKQSQAARRGALSFRPTHGCGCVLSFAYSLQFSGLSTPGALVCLGSWVSELQISTVAAVITKTYLILSLNIFAAGQLCTGPLCAGHKAGGVVC